MYRKLLVGSLAILAAPMAAAQETWDWSVTPYLWGAGIDGTTGLGPVEVDMSVDFSDIVDVLSGAALIHVEAQRGSHGLFGDVIFLAVESDPETTASGGQVEAEFDTTIVELGYVKSFSTTTGLELGIRYWDLELQLNPTTLPSVERDQDWVDGFVGLRFATELGDDWNWITRANLGAGGSDFTYGVSTVFGREFRSGNQFMFGLKLLDIDYEEANANGIPFRMDAMFLGATIGYMFD